MTLNLDYRQNGLGSNSCGPVQSPANTVTSEPFRFRMLLKPYFIGRHGSLAAQPSYGFRSETTTRGGNKPCLAHRMF
ncbi:hypothetical protein [Paenibacillus sp. LHD-38]|uniref:hypothetical protein n=1 Tax=Paenibacillus sp. LHD-38 TaxID=3072143 RepID=UPI0035BE587A